MAYLVETVKDGSFIASTETYKEALAIQDKKLKEGIDSYIREANTEESKEKTPDELLHEFFNSADLKNMSENQVRHWSNIMSSIVELRKLRKENPNDNSMGLWMMFMLMILPTNFITDFKSKENEAN